MMFLFNWTLFFEILVLVIFLLGLIAVGSVFAIRSLRACYKELYKYQSKFDIELRKLINLLSKTAGKDELAEYNAKNVKKLPFEEKKEVLAIIDGVMERVSEDNPDFEYITRTHERLQENRRIRDTKAAQFNQRIYIFPFNVYAKILGYHPYGLYSKQ